MSRKVNLYFKISIFYLVISFDLCLSGRISSKIDFGPDEGQWQEQNLNRNTGRNNGNNRAVMNYIRVFMNGQNPNPCEEESCNLTLVKKKLLGGGVLTNVYINMDESQIDTEAEGAITIKVTHSSQGGSQYGPSNQHSIPGNPSSFPGYSGKFQGSPGALPEPAMDFGRPLGVRFYPQRPEFQPSSPHHGPASTIISKGIVDDKIEFPLSKTKN